MFDSSRYLQPFSVRSSGLWIVDSLRGIRRQLGRAREERRSRRHATAPLRPVGGTLELSGDLVIRSRRRLRPVPGSSIWVRVRISHLGQRRVYRLALAT